MIRVAWVPTSTDLNRGSFRLQAYYNSQWLNSNGVHSEIIDYDSRPRGSWKDRFDVVIWFRSDQPSDAFEHDVPVVFFVSDGPIPPDEFLDKAIAIVSDTPVVVWNRLSSQFTSKSYVVPVTAPGDVPQELRTFRPRLDPPKTLVWVGTHQNLLWAKPILNHLSTFWPVEILTSGPEATKQWTLDTVASSIQQHGIGIIPMAENLEFEDLCGFNPLAKDPDRLTLIQACGIPVIASPIPGWTAYLRNGQTGLICSDRYDFEKAIRDLFRSPSLLNQMAECGHAQAWAFASEMSTGSAWKKILERTLKR